jgi:hypothetical protein
VRYVRITQTHVLPESRGDLNDKQELPDERAASLVAAGLAEYFDIAAHAAPLSNDEAQVRLLQEREAAANGTVHGQITTIGNQPPSQESVPKPDGRSTVTKWREWAVSEGADADEVAELDKASLMAQYGDRL